MIQCVYSEKEKKTKQKTKTKKKMAGKSAMAKAGWEKKKKKKKKNQKPKAHNQKRKGPQTLTPHNKSPPPHHHPPLAHKRTFLPKVKLCGIGTSRTQLSDIVLPVPVGLSSTPTPPSSIVRYAARINESWQGYGVNGNENRPDSARATRASRSRGGVSPTVILLLFFFFSPEVKMESFKNLKFIYSFFKA
jgi:hypothetical protein